MTPPAEDPCGGVTPFKGAATPQPPDPLRADDRVQGLGPFAGGWYHHGATLDLYAGGTGIQGVTDNSVGTKLQTVTWIRYRNPDRIVLTLISQGWIDGHNELTSAPSPGACTLAAGEDQPGDKELLRLVAPHLAEVVPILSHHAPDPTFRFFWCQEGLSDKYSDPMYCGL